MPGVAVIVVVRLLTVRVLTPPTPMVVGLKTQVVPAEQAKVMLPVKVFGPLATIVKVVDVLPISTGFLFPLAGELSEKAASPTPEIATVWGLPVALSAMLKEPLRVPLAVGEKVTLTLQLCPTLRVLSRAPQVSVSE